MTGRIVADHAKQILDVTKGDPAPTVIITDHDAEDRKTFERETGKRTTAARKEVSPGIQALQQRLAPAGDGHPRIFFMRDSLVELDEELRDAGLPTCTEEEFDSYIWDNRLTVKKEQPVKENDHGMDMTRYTVAQFDLKAQKAKTGPSGMEQRNRWRRES